MDARGALRPASDMLQLVLMITVDIGRVDHIFNLRARAHTLMRHWLLKSVCGCLQVLFDGPASLSWV